MVVKKEQGLKSSPAEAGGFNQKEDYKKMRLRTLKDLDQATAILVDACKLLLNTEFSDHEIRDTIYTAVGHEALVYAVENATALKSGLQVMCFIMSLNKRKKQFRNFYLRSFE